MSYLTNKSVPAVADRVKREAINMRFNALSFVGQNASTRVHSTFVSSHLSPLFLILPLPNCFVHSFDRFSSTNYLLDAAYFKSHRIPNHGYRDARDTGEWIIIGNLTSTDFVEYRFVPDFRIVNSTSRVKRVTEFGARFNTIKSVTTRAICWNILQFAKFQGN